MSMTWVLVSVAVAVLLLAGEVWWTRRRQPAESAGMHRPETLVLVDDLHGITYPHLYRRYQAYTDRYGRGAEQAWYWCWRIQRKAELLQSAANRRAMADYRWLVLYEQTDQLPAVTS